MSRDWSKELGIKNLGRLYHNLGYEDIREHELNNQEGDITTLDALTVDTGKFTGRSPKDKYFVDSDPSNKYIAWGDINHPVSKEIFDKCQGAKICSMGMSGDFELAIECGANMVRLGSIMFNK